MAKRRLSKYAQEYRKQRKRIQSTIYRYRRQGLIVQYELPEIPKTITPASTRRLKRITPQTIQNKTFGANEYGEKISYKKQRAIAKEEKKKIKKQPKILKTEKTQYSALPNETDIVIQNFKAYISAFNEAAQGVINDWLSRLMFSHDNEEVANMLQKSSEDGSMINYKVVYNQTLLFTALSKMVDNMEEIGTLERDKLIEAMEYDEDYTI